ncbi:four helix bundle protein [Candidatus Uhrbacteria bacterium]|nr:four helix bundle protein [Candidatus Uhrbacteria bacterium]
MSNKIYNLEERTAQFGEAILDFSNFIPDTIANRILKSQLIRSGTSIGANYMEADSASTKRDFMHKIAICKKEAKETKHWLRMVMKQNQKCKEKATLLSNEAQELVLIFSAIINSS